MADVPALAIRRNFQRTSRELVTRFSELPTGVICDAQGRVGALDHGIRPITSATKFCGPALVVDAGPRDNLAAWAGLEVAIAGDVVVIATGDHVNAAVIGDNFAAMAKNAGVAALVTDGVVRDLEGLNAVGIPVFARGVTPNSPWKNGPGTVGLEAAVGGVTVRSGDVIIGDLDGVVRVPRTEAEAVAEAAQAVLAKEQAMQAAWRGGASVPDWLAGTYEEKGVRWLDDDAASATDSPKR